MISTRNLIISTLALLSFLLIAACGDDAPTSGPGPNVAPKSGSSYSFSRVNLDSNGVKVPGTDTGYTMTVMSTDNSFAGKNNVVLFRQDTARFYVSYESNGDFAIHAAVEQPEQTWLVYPSGSKTTHNLPTIDTTIESPFGGTIAFSSRGSIAYSGTESVTVPAGTFQTHKLTQTMTTSFGSGASKIISTSVNTINYAPSIGWTVKVVGRSESTGGGFDGPPSGSEEVLTSYTLK